MNNQIEDQALIWSLPQSISGSCLLTDQGLLLLIDDRIKGFHQVDLVTDHHSLNGNIINHNYDVTSCTAMIRNYHSINEVYRQKSSS